MREVIINSIRNYEKWWLLLYTLLIIAIIAGGIVFGFKQWGGGNSIAITLPPTTASTLEIYLTGAVANEGIYTFSEDSSIRDIVQGAGEITDDADLSSIEIHIPIDNEASLVQPQKININTAEAWLLEALPGIGPTLAQRIIKYRENEGVFKSIDELTKVEGIGAIILDKFRDKITVVD
jgi:competence protein ComEA